VMRRLPVKLGAALGMPTTGRPDAPGLSLDPRR